MRWNSVEYSGSWLNEAAFTASPSSRLHRSPLRSIGHGKSYPVTAAQLLPVFTGFLAPIHFFKLAKNWAQNYPFALRASRLICPAARGADAALNLPTILGELGVTDVL